MMRNLLFLFGLIIMWHNVYGQQTPQYTQYLFNPVYINPAYSGYKGSGYLQTFHRNQWAGLEGAPKNYGVAYDSFITDYSLGYGGYIKSDQIGALTSVAIYANLSYHLQLSANNYLSFGAGVGLWNMRIDESKLDPQNPDDPILGTGKNRVSYPDIKLGLFYYSEHAFLSLAVENVLKDWVKYDFGNVYIQPDMALYFSGGLAFNLTNDLVVKPSFMLLEDFKSPARLDINSSFLYNKIIGIGLGYRTRLDYAKRIDSSSIQQNLNLLLLFELFLTENIRLGYSYDHSVKGALMDFQSHELSLGFRFTQRRNRILSPRFF